MPPTNQEIADLFENMATLLEIKGDGIFKIRAYQNAASTISHLSFSLEEAVQDGMDLKSIPGIGDAISQKIHEMCSTGEVGAYERLKEELPNGVLNLMSVPGIGPKTACSSPRSWGPAPSMNWSRPRWMVAWLPCLGWGRKLPRTSCAESSTCAPETKR